MRKLVVLFSMSLLAGHLQAQEAMTAAQLLDNGQGNNAYAVAMFIDPDMPATKALGTVAEQVCVSQGRIR